MSDIGNKRKSNQDRFDYIEIKEEDFCFAFVCDGMGGQNAGDVASDIVSRLFYENINKNLKNFISMEVIKDIIIDCYLKANSLVFEKAVENEEFKGMGTTCSVVVIKKNNLMVFSVGDSRVYLFSDDFLQQLTVDHSYVQVLIDSGEITKEQAKTHPRKNEITKAVGISKYIEVDFKNIEIKQGDVILLCTDGLTNSCGDVEIEDIIKKRKTIDCCVKELIYEANVCGGNDNITAVLIEV